MKLFERETNHLKLRLEIFDEVAPSFYIWLSNSFSEVDEDTGISNPVFQVVNSGGIGGIWSRFSDGEEIIITLEFYQRRGLPARAYTHANKLRMNMQYGAMARMRTRLL